MDFGVLALIVLAGLAGPLVGAGGRVFVPVVIGEILAGVIVGRTGLDIIDPADPTVRFLSEVGFAMLMFTVGRTFRFATHSSRRRCAAAWSRPPSCWPSPRSAAWLAARFAGTGDAAVYAVILGSGSAAAVLSMLDEARLSGPRVLTVIGQVTIADVVTIVAIPLVLSPIESPRPHSGAGWSPPGPQPCTSSRTGSIGKEWAHRLRKRSKQRRWALDLRLSLLVLFTLSWIAQESGTSGIVAGFATGLLVAAFGRPNDCSPRSVDSRTGSSCHCSSSSSALG